MNRFRHSYSRVSDYIRCPRLYRCRHMEDRPDPKTGPALLGGICHAFFEAYDRHLMAAGLPTDHAAADALMRRVFQGFERPLPPELYDEYLAICRDFIKNHVLDVGACVGVELEIAVTRALTLCDWNADEAWFRFKLDRLDIRGTRAVVTDYKTGWGGDADPFQLLLYACAVWIRHAQKPFRDHVHFRAVEAVVHYNRSGRASKRVFTPSDIESGIEKMREYAAKIEDETAWLPTPGPHCGACAYAGDCPARPQQLAPLMTQADAVRVAAEMELLRAQAQAREDSLRLWVQRNGPVPVRGRVYGYGSREHYKVLDAVGFVEAVQKAGRDATDFYDIDTAELKKACRRDAILADAVAPHVAVEVKETFGLRPAHDTDPYPDLTQNQGEPNDETKNQGKTQGPQSRHGPSGPRPLQPAEPAGTAPARHGRTRRGPARLQLSAGPGLGEPRQNKQRKRSPGRGRGPRRPQARPQVLGGHASALQRPPRQTRPRRQRLLPQRPRTL